MMKMFEVEQLNVGELSDVIKYGDTDSLNGRIKSDGGLLDAGLR